MKTNTIRILSNREPNHVSHAVLRSAAVGALAAAVFLGFGIACTRAQEAGQDDQGVEVLIRGPVHEAFAGVLSFNPEPGVIVNKTPPVAIEELPPEERPKGDNITWIPGYWAWDDERSDFLWISGMWRALPPGREWIAGYWTTVENGDQWISGYWANAAVEVTTYLPKPPATLETGPNVAAPSPDYGWTPGNWAWRQERYAWRPGYWATGRTDWEWMPAHYVWTPRGYIFVDGYWDHGIARRGVLFAPVHFGSGVYSRPGYHYSPLVAINLLAFVENLFVRPRYHHYYFGDYYDRGYETRGFYSPFAFQSKRHGYDPVYSHQRWQHRQDRDWERNFKTSYQYRRDHKDARPPHTWSAQKRLKPDARQQGPRMATSFDQMAKAKDSHLRFKPLPAKERQKLAKRSQDIQKSREGRRTLEAISSDVTAGKNKQKIKPTRVKLPKSSIVGKSSNKLKKDQAPPKPQRAPDPTSKVRPKPQGTDRQPEADKKQPKPERTQKPSREKAAEPSAKPRREPQRPSTKQERKEQPQAQRPSKEKPEKTRSQPQSKDQQKPRQETVKPHGKGSSTPGEEDEKSTGKGSKKGRR